MSSDGWWARKLGNPPPAVPQYQQQSYPATQQPSYRPPPLGAQTPLQHVQVTKDNVVELAGLWQGGQGTKTETSRCPQCSSGDYFSRMNVSGSRVVNTSSGTTASAAPHCFDCGFNGLYTQAGG